MTQPFHPPQRTLMGPGPSDVNPRILEAMSRPTIGHLDPAFVGMMDEMKALLRYAFRTENALTMPISAPGSAGMESCFVNLVEPGDKVVVCQNGVFGGRMKENVERAGGVAIMQQDPWGRAVDPQKLEETLKTNPDAKIVAFVHAETSTGAQSDAETLCKIAHDHGCLTIVDAVTSLGGSPLEVDKWGIDAIYSGSQKCLSCTPGLSPVSFNDAALKKVRDRTTAVQSWFLDLNLVMGYWDGGGKRAYHHTAPINALYGMHEALVVLEEEGVESCWTRHQNNHLALRAGIEAMGLEFVVPESERLPQLNAVTIPEGVDDAAVRSTLLNHYSLEIGAGLGDLAGKVWRIGQMGYASNEKNILNCLAALDAVLSSMGAPIHQGEAVAAARAAYR
ncbi:MAG: alanine--glyoxylate aminotransferase family protein [Gammaproteobacteria bacterium]|jgi:alanine-glyoxylate transaminase / serine-glyoxylate transaminase / serine-pyruvate transaminase|nr:alanine--glyoxylate aminotransferase family protein [Gammaproteobacteria bacterium]MBT3489312.1 alanine--glyoxylate aminotransferase family protein [Gammaproteobacteria bacterium]MBT3718692.1 alanine--glyoxylate aminotransferase family protein [Gammaproteobacteria bacterium]MBT3843788.1 alanine--glyoxylate aminotransferase family protein [Gammaproteobacteria bacterium]MBT3893986.1 alanine--glyoxylate aminotransferase family protein [Gammaproteobacteria bacterium]